MELFVQRNGSFYKGCGCGGVKEEDKVAIEPGWKPIFMQKTGPVTGPSGINYTFTQNTISIDVDVNDANYFISSGHAREPLSGLKGRKARNG